MTSLQDSQLSNDHGDAYGQQASVLDSVDLDNIPSHSVDSVKHSLSNLKFADAFENFDCTILMTAILTNPGPPTIIMYRNILIPKQI